MCRLFFSLRAKTIESDIFDVLICFFDGLRETSNMVFDLIHLMYYCEWCFFMQVLVGSPASVDCFSFGQPRLKKTDIFDVLICFFDGPRDSSNMVFDIIHLTFYCEWAFFHAPAHW